MKKVGVIGLGNMGRSMARNLMKAGYEVNVYDIRPEAVADLAREGAAPATSVKELGERSEAVFVMVLNYAQAKGVCMGAGGLFEGMKPGSVVIVTCTISQSETRSIGAAAAERGIDMIDSPVSGGTPGAEAGTLVMMAACRDDVYERSLGVLKAVGSNTFHVGREVGMGQTVKAAIQLLVSIHVIAAAEAFALSQKAGVEPEMLAEIVNLSVGASRMFELKAPKIINRDFSNSGALDIQIKDLNICLTMGRELNVPLFLSAASRELYIMAEGMGYGREDLCAVIKLYEKSSGVPVGKKAE